MIKRGRNQKLTEKEFERVIENRGLGFQNRESAEQIGISEGSVANVLRAFDDIRREDWNDIVFMRNKAAASMDLIKWATEKLEKEIPQAVWDLFMIQKEKEIPSREQPETETSETGNEALWMLKILETLQQIAEATAKVADTQERLAARLSVIEKQVLPDMAKEITSNANANGDMLNNTLLDIRSNTRKRGA
jgi:hypothetical protein